MRHVLREHFGPLYHVAGGRAGRGNNLILDEIHEPRAWVPKRMAPLRPLVGGIIVALLTLASGTHAYNGLSRGIAQAALRGSGVVAAAFALKLVFTSITLGSGMQGGEVTPLFVMGAALGATLAAGLGVPVALLAACGFVAVFAGAANTPLACTVMAVELFGPRYVGLFAVACVVSYVFSSHHGIYGRQRVAPSDDAEQLSTIRDRARPAGDQRHPENPRGEMA